MKKKPIIGIVGRTDKINEKNVIQVNENYRLAIIKSGGLPIIIVPPDDEQYDLSSNYHRKLNNTEKKDILCILQLCDGILMPGGTKWYEFDEFICEFAIENDKALLGICLGMQIMANMKNFCGTLESDKTTKNESKINHFQENAKHVHKITAISEKMKKILKKEILFVNSRHNYHILQEKWFDIEAYSEDNIIEAISIPNCKFALGVQWHPEDMISYEIDMLEIFKQFVENCH